MAGGSAGYEAESLCQKREARVPRSRGLGITSPGNYPNDQIAETAEERKGSTRFNLIPVAAGGSAAPDTSHPATTPYDVAAWWVKYLLPPKGVLLDCFCGSGTMLAAGLDFGALKVIGIEKEKKYLKIAENRIATG